MRGRRIADPRSHKASSFPWSGHHNEKEMPNIYTWLSHEFQQKKKALVLIIFELASWTQYWVRLGTRHKERTRRRFLQWNQRGWTHFLGWSPWWIQWPCWWSHRTLDVYYRSLSLEQASPRSHPQNSWWYSSLRTRPNLCWSSLVRPLLSR